MLDLKKVQKINEHYFLFCIYWFWFWSGFRIRQAIKSSKINL